MTKRYLMFFAIVFVGCKSPFPGDQRPVMKINEVLEQEDQAKKDSLIQDSLKKKNLSVVPYKPRNNGDSLYNF